MTDTTTLTPAATSGETRQIDPHTLVIETNVRTTTALTEEFIDSVRINGVLTPVLAHQTSDGTIVVRAGQRRTLAARQANLASIPVWVVPVLEATADRIVQQVIENDQRETLTDTDRITAWQQLAFEGLTPTAIARRLSRDKATIQHGLTIAASPTATEALSTGITLDHAAALIEFEDDPDTIADLTEVACTDPKLFQHALQRARDERARSALRTAAETDLAAAGWTIISRNDAWAPGTPWVAARNLLTTDGETPDLDTLTALDQRAAQVEVWGDQAHINHYAHRDTLDQHGLTARIPTAPAAGSQTGPMSEEQKADRRTLIANNKAWDSAQTVRRDWLTTLLTRKTLPKDSSAFTAEALLTHRHQIANALTDGNRLAATLLGVTDTGRHPISGWLTSHPTRAAHVTLAVVLAGIEDATSRTDWRTPDARTAGYLHRLAAWGYHPSEVEQIITTAHPASSD